MASQIANNMSNDDKSAMENMDIEKMISHVTQNVFKMMNGNENAPEGLSDLLGTINIDSVTNIMDSMNLGGIMGNFNQTSELEDETDFDENYLMPKTRDICFDLNVDLADFYTGKKKKLNIKRKRIIEVDGKQKVVEEKKKIIIPIEKGMKDEQQIRFEGEADQIPGYKPGDIIITLIENEHPFFQRDNDNLVIIKNINIYQLYDYSFDITHLDSKIIRVSKNVNDSLHLNDSLRKITGQGMPITGKNTFGDLFIRFNLVIPKSIEPEKLLSLKNIFYEIPEVLSDNFNCQFSLENVTETDLEEFDSDSSDSESVSSEESDSSDSSDSSLSSVSIESAPRRKFKRK